MRLRVLVGILALSLVALFYRSRLQAWAGAIDPGKKAGQVAPAFAAQALDGQPVSLASLRGKVVLLHFWTFGCGNCEHMVPSYNAWDARFRARGLRVVGVHTPETDAEHSGSKLRSTVAERHITWTVVPDDEERIWDAYGVKAWPTVFLIDRDGRIAATFVGDDRPEDIERAIDELLG